jgi:hypothetical protein
MRYVAARRVVGLRGEPTGARISVHQVLLFQLNNRAYFKNPKPKQENAMKDKARFC